MREFIESSRGGECALVQGQEIRPVDWADTSEMVVQRDMLCVNFAQGICEFALESPFSRRYIEADMRPASLARVRETRHGGLGGIGPQQHLSEAAHTGHVRQQAQPEQLQ
jgi:hypothetical protein